MQITKSNRKSMAHMHVSHNNDCDASCICWGIYKYVKSEMYLTPPLKRSHQKDSLRRTWSETAQRYTPCRKTLLMYTRISSEINVRDIFTNNSAVCVWHVNNFTVECAWHSPEDYLLLTGEFAQKILSPDRGTSPGVRTMMMMTIGSRWGVISMKKNNVAQHTEIWQQCTFK